MDGNGRWAKRRGLPRTAGHAAGAETFRTIATYCKEIGLEYLTVYAFSTENWKRPKEEVYAIMGLLKKYLHGGHPARWSGTNGIKHEVSRRPVAAEPGTADAVPRGRGDLHGALRGLPESTSA